jgi:hypothetical protein
MDHNVTTELTIPHIISSLKQKHFLPKAAIDAALAQGKKIVPALLELLKDAVENFQRIDADDNSYITVMYILAKMREPQACRYIIRMASLYRDWPEKLLGDVLIDDGASLIVSTYDGNLQAIKNLIEHTHAYIYSRTAALESLIGLFAIGTLSREEVIDYYRTLLRSPLVEDYEFAMHLLDAVYDLYPRELWDDVMAVYDNSVFDPWATSKEEFRETLEGGMEACLKENIYTNKFYLPIDDVVKEIASLYVDEEKEKSKEPARDCACCNKFGTHTIVKQLLAADAAEDEVDA